MTRNLNYKKFSSFLLVLVAYHNLWAASHSQPKETAVSNPTSSALKADLQQLRQQLALLSAQVSALEKQKASIDYKEKQTKTDQSPIQVVKNGSDKTALTVSGWVNRALVYYDNGRRSEVKNVDASEYSSRLKIAGESRFDAKSKVGATLEMQAVSNSSYKVDIGQNSDAVSNVSFNKRVIEVFYEHNQYGTLFLGQGPTASDTVGDCDLSNTGLVTEGGDLAAMAGGVRFIRGNVAETSLPPLPTAILTNASSPDKDRSINSVWVDVMGPNRTDRVRYDTPNYNGFKLSVAYGTRDVSDVGLRYAAEWNRTKFIAGVGYLNTPFTFPSATNTRTDRKGTRQYGGSASILFPTGISLGGTAAAKSYGDPGRRMGSMWSLKAGYQHQFFSWGLTNLAVVYGQNRALYDGITMTSTTGAYTPTTFTEDNSQKVKIYGLYMVQNIDKISTDVFGGVQYHSLSRTPYGETTAIQTSGYGFKHILAAMLGGRVRF